MAAYDEQVAAKGDVVARAFAPLTPQFIAMEEWAVATLKAMTPVGDSRWLGWLGYQTARCIRIFRSCRLLLASGHCLEALALSRALQDSWLLVAWVAEDPDTRVRRVIEGETMTDRRRTLTILHELSPKDERFADLLATVFGEEAIKGVPQARQLAEKHYSDQGLLLYATLYGLASAFLHGRGDELQYVAGWSGTRTFSVDPWPSMLGFNEACLAVHEVFRAAVDQGATAARVATATPPLLPEFSAWRDKVMKSGELTGS
ncbi:MAG: hypothetical protein M0Z36_09190 [Thermaerobacter sp.]|nr:hypothetical protein [Thermaerobacter sp.]